MVERRRRRGRKHHPGHWFVLWTTITHGMESSNTHLVRASSSSSSSSSSTPSSRLSSSSSSQGGSVPPATLTPPPPRRPDWWSTAIATGDHHHGDDSAGDGSPNQKQQPNDHITTGNDGDGGDSSSDWDWVDDPDDPLSSSKEPPLPAGLPLVEVALDPLEHPATDISTIASKEQSTETAATVILVVKNESNKDVNSRRPDNTWNANPSTAEMTSPPVPSTQSTPTAPVVTNNTSTFLDPEPTLSIGGGSTTGTSGSGNSDDDAEYSTFDDDVLDEFPMVMDKPLQTLEKLQHMLDETDYLTTSRTTSQPFGSSTKLSPPSASTFVPPPNAAMENGKDDTSSNNASSSENTLPAVAESLWTSKDRSKYKRQQRNARAASESVVGSSGTTGSTNPASAGSSVSRSGTTATTVGSLPPPFAATTSTTSIQQQPPQLQPQSRQRQPPPPLPSTTTTAATSTANPRRQIFSPSWPRSSQTMSSLDAAVVSSSDGIEDQSDTDDGLGYTLPNLPVYLSDDEGDYFSEATTTTTASGFSEEDAAMAAAARAAAAAANYAQLQRWNPPVYPQQQQQQPQQQGPSMMYPGYPYSTSGPPQWTTATPPHQQYGYYPPPQAIHSQQQYYLPPQAQGTYPPPASLSPPPGYFYPQQYLPPTPSLNSMYASQRIHKGESSSMHYNDPKLLPLEDPFSSSPYDMVPSSSMSVERPPMNNNGVYHHPRHPILQLQSPLVPPLEDWQYAPTPVLLGHFWRALGSLTQIATCLILSTLVCYAAVSPRNLPFLEYNQKFYEILKIASLAWIPPVVVSSLVVDRASNRLSCLVNGFFSAFTMGYVGTFVLEIVAATITRLAVFAAWEPNVFDMTPQVPLITIPWVLRDQKYLVKPITLIVQDLVTSVAVCPVVEEWMKLVIFKAVIPRGRNFSWVRKSSKSNPSRRKWIAEPVAGNVPDESLQIPGRVVNVNHYVSGMLSVSVGLKLADAIRRTCMYTKAGDANKRFYAFFRGVFPIQELCGTVTALSLARRDVLGQKTPLWKLLLPSVVIHAMANFRGMKPIFKWNSATPWTEMQLLPNFYAKGASITELASKAFPKVMWMIILFRVAGYCIKNYYMINRQAVKRTTTYAGKHAAFSAELAAAEMLKKNSKEN